jgi:predicted O-methyltransferase YrrM
MSTIWLARRVQFLISVESDSTWFRNVSGALERQRLHNVQYELRSRASYPDLSDFPDGHFDLVLVDGQWRSDCIQEAVPKVRGGGWVYLDNTDDALADSDLREAEAALVQAIALKNGSAQYFTDLVPCQLITTQGLLAML